MKIETENQPMPQTQPGHRSIKSGALNLWGAQVSRRGTRLLFLLIAARVLGPPNFGLYTLLLTITEMLAIVTGSGFGEYITRELARVPESAFHVSEKVTQLRWIYSTIVGFILLAVLRWMNYDKSVLLMAFVMLLSLFPRAILETCQGALKAAEEFRWYAITELTQGLSLFVVGVPLLRGLGLTGVVFTELAAVAIAASVALIPSLRLFPRRSDVQAPSFHATVRSTIPFNVYPLIAQVYDRVDVILLSKLASNTAVGIYGLPYKFYASLQILPFGIFGTMLPRLSRSDWKSDTHASMSRVLEALFAASLLLVLVVNLVASPGVRLLLGEAYQGSSVALKILIWACIPMFLNYGFNTVLLANRREKVFLITTGVCLVVNVVGNLLLIPRYSYRAAAAVTVVTELVLLAQNLYWVHRKVGKTLLTRPMIITASCFLVALGIALAGPRLMQETFASSIAILFFAIYLYSRRKSLLSQS